ncbi:TadE/TadG family type IV pilus assembly protein [Roseivivax sp. CAU 1753]
MVSFKPNKRFVTDEGGSYSVEAVIWLPIFIFLTALIIDVSSIYYDKSQIAQIVQNANRAYSVGSFITDAETEDNVRESLLAYSANATVDTSVVDSNIETRVVVPASDLMGLNIFPAFAPVNIVIAYKHLKEW